jgi:hypothetical protein
MCSRQPSAISFHWDPGDAEFGFNVGAGVQIPVKPRFAIEGPTTTITR